MELTFSKKCIVDYDEWLINHLQQTILLTQLHTINMNNIYSDLNILIKILQFTSNIHIYIYVYIKDTPHDLLSIQESETFRLVSAKNQIENLVIKNSYTKKWWKY